MVVRFLLQEPVKDAVKEALHEEGLGSQPESDRTSDTDYSTVAPTGTGGSGPSRFMVGAVLVGLGSLAYVVRRRRQSGTDWSADDTHQQEHGRDATDTHTAGTTGGRDESTAVGDGP